MTIICSANQGVRERWSNALDQSPRLQEACDLVDLKGQLAVRETAVVLLHLSLPALDGRNGVVALRHDYPQAKFLLYADQPNEAEGLLLLQDGAYGYCNTYMAPALLARAVETVREGEVWVGWNLMQRLIQGMVDPQQSSVEQLDDVLSELTEREKEIAIHVAKGASNKRIAIGLGITERTVKAHLSTIFRKTETRDRLQLALLVKGQMA